MRLLFTNCLMFNHDPLVCQPIRRWCQALLSVFEAAHEEASGMPGRRLPRCEKLLEALMCARKYGAPDTQLAWCFVRPVDPVEYNCPDYYDVVTEPMDFGSISCKLYSQQYESEKDFFSDVYLVFDNVRKYNRSRDDWDIRR